MQVTLEIEPATFSLLQRAEEEGVSVDDVLRDALSKIDRKKHFQDEVSAEEWIESLMNWANKKRTVPHLSDEMLRRENLYEDRV